MVADQKLIAMNINFDSLFFPLTIDRQKYRDPSFYQIADRFFALSEKYKFRYTIFVIGRDLENPEVFARVRAWSQAGHEIGNHTWTHHHNLGALPRPRMEEEVLRAHEIIARCTGAEPRGFISPAWSTSGELIDVLIRAGYLYDTSVFPSPLLALAMAKLSLNARSHGVYNASWWSRRDKRAAFFAPRKPYFLNGSSLIRKRESGILMLPLPTLSPFRIPCWHTFSFFLGSALQRALIRLTANTTDAFYYLMHPADLADWERDLDPAFREQYAGEFALFERLRVPFMRKEKLVSEVFETLAKLGTFVTLEEMARAWINAVQSRSQSVQ